MPFDLSIPSRALLSKILVKIGGYVGFIQNGIWLTFTLFLIISGSSELATSVLHFALLNALIGLVLSIWLLMRYSHIAAILLLVFYFISRLEEVVRMFKHYDMGYALNPLGVALSLLLIVPYVLAVIGSINIHRLRKQHDSDYPSSHTLWLQRGSYAGIAVYILIFSISPSKHLFKDITKKVKGPSNIIASTKSDSRTQNNTGSANKQIDISNLQQSDGVLREPHTKKAPLIPIREIYGFVLTFPLGSNHVLLTKSRKAALWDAEQRRIWILNRNWRWYNSDWKSRYRAIAVDDRVLFAGFLQRNTDKIRKDVKTLYTRNTDLLLYDPATKNQKQSIKAKLSNSRGRVVMITLSDNQVLITGGLLIGDRKSAKSAELITVLANKLKVEHLPDMHYPRSAHAIVKLPDGRVMVIGGTGESANKAEIYNPETKSWHLTSPLNTGRRSPKAVVFKNANVLVVSGRNDRHSPVSTMELWDATTEKWKVLKGPLHEYRTTASVIKLNENQIIVIGGRNARDTEIYDLRKAKWSFGPVLQRYRDEATAILTRDGTIHVIGGMTGSGSYRRWDGSVEVLTLK